MPIDDRALLTTDFIKEKKMIAVVSPAVATSFGEDYMRFNTYLKSIGFEVIYDMSIGVEMMKRSYKEFFTKKRPHPTISRECPAIVNYIELYQPDLIEHIVTIKSALGHTVSILQEMEEVDSEQAIVVFTPCLGHRREVKEYGKNVLSITFSSVQKKLEKSNTSLKTFEETPYDNFSSPDGVILPFSGGLTKVLQPSIAELQNKTRVIAGALTYRYLEDLPAAISEGVAPPLIDCLNCRNGCHNSSTSTTQGQENLDHQDTLLQRRGEHIRQQYQETLSEEELTDKMEELVNAFWGEEIFQSHYMNLSTNNNKIFVPSDEVLNTVYTQLHLKKGDNIAHFDCGNCGYETCQKMAIAICHGLNRVENCEYFITEELHISRNNISENEKHLRNVLFETSQGFCLTDEEFQVVAVNPRFCNLFGTTEEAILGTPLLAEQFHKCFSEEKEVIEITISREEGEEFICLFSPTPYYVDGEVVGYFAFLTTLATRQQQAIGNEVEGTSQN